MPDLYYIQDTRQIVGNCAVWWRRVVTAIPATWTKLGKLIPLCMETRVGTQMFSACTPK